MDISLDKSQNEDRIEKEWTEAFEEEYPETQDSDVFQGFRKGWHGALRMMAKHGYQCSKHGPMHVMNVLCRTCIEEKEEREAEEATKKIESERPKYRPATHKDFEEPHVGHGFDKVNRVPGGWVVKQTWHGIALCFIPFPEKEVLVEKER